VDPRWDDDVASEWAMVCAGIGARLSPRQEVRRLATALIQPHQGAATTRAAQSRAWTLTRTFRDEFGCAMQVPHPTPHRDCDSAACEMAQDRSCGLCSRLSEYEEFIWRAEKAHGASSARVGRLSIADLAGDRRASGSKRKPIGSGPARSTLPVAGECRLREMVRVSYSASLRQRPS
jgi:hypothetical protein